MNDVSFILEGLKLNVKACPFSTNLLVILKSQPFNRTGIHGIQIIFFGDESFSKSKTKFSLVVFSAFLKRP